MKTFIILLFWDLYYLSPRQQWGWMDQMEI